MYQIVLQTVPSELIGDNRASITEYEVYFHSKYLLFLSFSLFPVYNKGISLNFKGIYCDFS